MSGVDGGVALSGCSCVLCTPDRRDTDTLGQGQRGVMIGRMWLSVALSDSLSYMHIQRVYRVHSIPIRVCTQRIVYLLYKQ